MMTIQSQLPTTQGPVYSKQLLVCDALCIGIGLPTLFRLSLPCSKVYVWETLVMSDQESCVQPHFINIKHQISCFIVTPLTYEVIEGPCLIIASTFS